VEPKCRPARVLRDLGQGDFFGEQALLTEERRSANVISLPPGVEVLTLDRDSFLQLIGGMNEFNQLRKSHDLKCGQEQTTPKDVLVVDTIAEKVENIQLAGGAVAISIEKEDMPTDFSKLTLNDLEFVATLGVGGFGRVELVQVNVFNIKLKIMETNNCSRLPNIENKN